VNSIAGIHRTVHRETVDWAKCTSATFHLAAMTVHPYWHWISSTDTIQHCVWHHSVSWTVYHTNKLQSVRSV